MTSRVPLISVWWIKSRPVTFMGPPPKDPDDDDEDEENEDDEEGDEPAVIREPDEC